MLFLHNLINPANKNLMPTINKIIFFFIIMCSLTSCIDKEVAAYNTQKNITLKHNADSLTRTLMNNTIAFQKRADSVSVTIQNSNNLFIDSLYKSTDSVCAQLDSILAKCLNINTQLNNNNINFVIVNNQIKLLNNSYDSLHTRMNEILTKLNLHNMTLLMTNINLLRRKIDTLNSLKLDTSIKFANFIYVVDSISLQLARIKTQVCYCYNQLNSKSDNLYLITSQVNELNNIFLNLFTKFNAIFEQLMPKKRTTSNNLLAMKAYPAQLGVPWGAFPKFILSKGCQGSD